MELQWAWISISITTLLASYVFVLRHLNGWYYEWKLRNKDYPLPPGDMGLPFIGNLVFFLKHFLLGQPDTFINNIILKFGRGGIYKTHLFMKPSIIVCEPEMCRRVMNDDVNFKLSYPKSIKELLKCKPLDRLDLTSEGHKHFRRLVTSPIVGHKVLAVYLEYLEDIMINSLEELASKKHPIELLKEMKEVSFKVIVHIFMGSSNQYLTTKIRSSFIDLYNGVFSYPINVPGFTFHKALQARKKLVKIIQPVLDERKMMMKSGQKIGDKNELMNILLEALDENGNKYEDEDIIGILIGLLSAGHETTATGLMWSITYLTQHPHLLKKAKEEQEEILRKRPSTQKKLNLHEIKQMVYLSQVINEMLRCANIIFSTFREAISDVNINGYLIPKGWIVLVWARAIHMNSEYFLNPKEFDPSRWDSKNAKPGTFIPFGAGSRLCPGGDLARLQISIFLHYFLLNYRLERINPKCPITILPTPKPKDNCLAKVIKTSSV